MAKTKNVKVRAKDLKAGIRIFVAHPTYGIEEYKVLSRPYFKKWSVGGTSSGSWWVNVQNVRSEEYLDARSLRDSGIPVGDGGHVDYNGRRTFFKRKHAEEWVAKWIKSPSFLKQHGEHVKNMEIMNAVFDSEYYNV